MVNIARPVSISTVVRALCWVPFSQLQLACMTKAVLASPHRQVFATRTFQEALKWFVIWLAQKSPTLMDEAITSYRPMA